MTVTASTSEPVTRAEAKLWLRLEETETEDDALLDSLIATARQRYEEHSQRALLTQTFDYYLDYGFPDHAVRLPRSPLISIGSVKGFSDTDATDTGGTSMNSSEYYVDTASEPGRVVPFGSYSWPSATRIANAAIIRFTAGYSSQTSGVPEQAKTTIKNMITRAYEFRGDQSQDVAALMDDVVRDELALPEFG